MEKGKGFVYYREVYWGSWGLFHDVSLLCWIIKGQFIHSDRAEVFALLPFEVLCQIGPVIKNGRDHFSTLLVFLGGIFPCFH